MKNNKHKYSMNIFSLMMSLMMVLSISTGCSDSEVSDSGAKETDDGDVS